LSGRSAPPRRRRRRAALVGDQLPCIALHSPYLAGLRLDCSRRRASNCKEERCTDRRRSGEERAAH
jgi:hypothetical protein